MVRPVIRAIDTIEEVEKLPAGGFAPHNEQHFALLIDAYIGPDNDEGHELFRFTVCTPDWFTNETVSGGARWLRHFMILERWNYEIVVSAVSKLCSSIESSSWIGVAVQLSRFMRWEFEDIPDQKT